MVYPHKTARSLISIIAVFISGLALWRSHFSRFKPLVNVGDLSIRICPVRNEGEKWYIVVFDTSINITNSGARPGIIHGLRLVLHYPDIHVPDNYEVFHARREVDSTLSSNVDENFFSWIDEVMISDWVPFTILSNEKVSKQYHFQGRWDFPVIQKSCICTLQIKFNNKRKWKDFASWEIILNESVWSELLTNKNSIAFKSQDSIQNMFEVRPSDLHKSTYSKEHIARGGFGIEPTYVDWPEDTD